jgi:hypothetical protein
LIANPLETDVYSILHPPHNVSQGPHNSVW